MAHEPESIVLEHLRHIRRVVDKAETDVGELKSRVTSFEPTMGHVKAQIASQTGRIDRIEGRLDRIELRLDVMHA
jgi:hypothetical protein